MILKVRKKPVEVHAIQVNMENSFEIAELLMEYCLDRVYKGDPKVTYKTGFRKSPMWVDIITLEGTMRAYENDWIIRGVNGELYPCKPDIFEKTYDIV